MGPLLDTVLDHVPAPAGDPQAPFSMLVAMLERDAHLGRVATGRVAAGVAKVGDRLKVLHHSGTGASVPEYMDEVNSTRRDHACKPAHQQWHLRLGPIESHDLHR